MEDETRYTPLWHPTWYCDVGPLCGEKCHLHDEYERCEMVMIYTKDSNEVGLIDVKSLTQIQYDHLVVLAETANGKRREFNPHAHKHNVERSVEWLEKTKDFSLAPFLRVRNVSVWCASKIACVFFLNSCAWYREYLRTINFGG
jgi:hypothetical protein